MTPAACAGLELLGPMPMPTRRSPLELFGGARHYRPTYHFRLDRQRRTVYDMADTSDNATDVSVEQTATAQAAIPIAADEFQALLVDVLPSAYGYALRLTRNRADAEDLVQDTALRAFRAMTTFEA